MSRLWWVVSLCLFAMITCFGQPKATFAAKWVLLEITDNAARIVATRRALHKAPFESLPFEESLDWESDSVRVFYHRKGHTRIAHMGPDPRIQVREGLSSHGSLDGKHDLLSEGHITIEIPEDVDYITVEHHASEHHTSSQKSDSSSTQYTLAVPSYEKFQVSEASDVEVITLQQVGPPTKHKSIVLLAAGYTKDEKNKFLAAVNTINSFMKGQYSTANIPNPVFPIPWDRYWPLINVVAIFQPSNESGASFPGDEFGNGGMPGVGEVIVKDNLDCRYGIESIRLLSCSFNKMLMLAQHAPVSQSRTTIMALVNSKVYGGTATYRKGSVYAGPWQACSGGSDGDASGANPCKNGYKMESDSQFLNVFIHELGHADARIADEYSYGVTQTATIALPNCHVNQFVPWQHWIKIGEVGEPVPTCTYKNYFKPTDNRCLFATVAAPEACAVCTEQSVLAIYRDTLQLDSPRCPHEHETMIVLDDDDVHYLAISDRFISGGVFRTRDQGVLMQYAWTKGFPADHPRIINGKLPIRIEYGEIETKWFNMEPSGPTLVVKGTLFDPKPMFGFRGKDLGVGTHTFQLEIVDDATFVDKQAKATDPAIKNMARNSTFRVKVVAANDTQYSYCSRASLESYTKETYDADKRNRDLAQCPLAGDLVPSKYTSYSEPLLRYYCAICDEGATCDEDYPTEKFQLEGDLESAYQSIEYILIGVVIGGTIGAIVLFALIAGIATYQWSNKPHEIFPYPRGIRMARIVLLVVEVLIAIFCIVAIAIACLKYSSLSVYGKTAALAVIAISGFIYLTTFSGFHGAWQNNPGWLTVSGVLWILLTLAVTLVVLVLFWINGHIENVSFVRLMRESWVEGAEDNPKSICRLEADFECSGFDVACNLFLHEQCPANCGLSNANPNPCYETVVGKVQQWFLPIAYMLIAVAGIMITALAINWIMCSLVHRRRQALKKRLEFPCKPSMPKAVCVIANLTLQEVQDMEDEFKKVDVNSDGLLDWRELRNFYRLALRINLSRQECEQALDILDADDNGKVSFKEFLLRARADDDVGGPPSSRSQPVEMTPKFNEMALKDPRVQALSLPTNTLKQLWVAFEGADKNRSHKLPVGQLKYMYQAISGSDIQGAQLQAIFDHSDKDRDGFVDFPETCILYKEYWRKVQERQRQNETAQFSAL